MKVCLSNLGCKLNQAELESLARQFHGAGFTVVGRLEEAELHVVNTCTVTHLAARDSRKTARRGARLGGIQTVLTGCYATEMPEEAAGLDGVALVVENDVKHDLLARVIEHLGVDAPAPRERDGVDVSYVPLVFGNSRAALKIEDGCNMKCSFCIIPYTRGRQRSRTIDESVEELNSLVRSGVREVVVTGVQISSYRSGEDRLVDVVEAMLERSGIERLRLTSIAPWQFDERLFALLREERLCRHVHLSLQSGCDDTLRRMRRPYTAAQYAELVDRLRCEVPGIAVTTDVIVGFPGETEREFAESYEFVERIGFTRTHVFTFSPRIGTRAAEMPDSVAHAVKKERTRQLIDVAAASERAFNAAQVGEELGVLWEEERNGLLRGTSDNYVRVVLEPGFGGDDPSPGDVGTVRITAVREEAPWPGVVGAPLTPRRIATPQLVELSVS
ncbi:MAG: tRNA (N(6)-L-threonylcarbamoyladenosine(37)-C(2))-methylthiotransferase MtaB [Acidobacteriota bacterium]